MGKLMYTVLKLAKKGVFLVKNQPEQYYINNKTSFLSNFTNKQQKHPTVALEWRRNKYLLQLETPRSSKHCKYMACSG